MNLPVVLDIAIGLVFIYLIASLLASELQELISTLLQWRAKHLRESIQNLLSGDYGTKETDQIRNFIESIYGDPLIKNVNQSSRGFLAQLGQSLYRIFYPGEGIFGKRTTAPSYISPETFSTALLEQVGMSVLVDKLTEIRLEKFISRIIGLYNNQEVSQNDGGSKNTITIPSDQDFEFKDGWEKGGIRVLAEKAKNLAPNPQSITGPAIAILTLDNHNKDFVDLVEEYNDILADFRAGEVDLPTCVERVREGLDNYINQVSEQIPSPNADVPYESAGLATLSSLERQQLVYFKKRLNTLRSSIFGEKNERAIAAGRLKPNLLEIAEVFDRTSLTYQEIEGAYQDVVAAYAAGTQPDEVQKVLDAIAAKVSEALKTGASTPGKLEPSDQTESRFGDPTQAGTDSPAVPSPSIDASVTSGQGDGRADAGADGNVVPEPEPTDTGNPQGNGEPAEAAERSGIESSPITPWQPSGDEKAPVTEVPPIVPVVFSSSDSGNSSDRPTSNPDASQPDVSQLDASQPGTFDSAQPEPTGSDATPPDSSQNRAEEPAIAAVQPPIPAAIPKPVAAAIAQTVTRMTSPLSDDDLLKTEYQPYIDAALSSFTPAEQHAYRQAYKGWSIYQQIVLKVIRSLAAQLQNEERLFNPNDQYLLAQPLEDSNRVYRKDQYLVQPYTQLDPKTLTINVKYSLRLMTNEERQLRVNQALNQLTLEQRKIYRHYQTYDEIQDFLGQVPASVKQSLAILARRAQSKVVQTDRQLSQFSTEISVWFDRSMNRASGVYKRNAKGVAIMIGFLIAFLSNADTFHIIARLSNDNELRQVIAQRASEVTQQTNLNNPTHREITSDDLRDLKNKTDAVLQEVSLPIQWTPTNLTRQFNCSSLNERNEKKLELMNRLNQTDPNKWSSFYNSCLPVGKMVDREEFNLQLLGEVIVYRPLAALKILVGWLVSGVAIAMGAPFWFDILGKIMNVRNTGTKPAPVAEKDPSKPPAA